MQAGPVAVTIAGPPQDSESSESVQARARSALKPGPEVQVVRKAQRPGDGGIVLTPSIHFDVIDAGSYLPWRFYESHETGSQARYEPQIPNQASSRHSRSVERVSCALILTNTNICRILLRCADFALSGGSFLFGK